MFPRSLKATARQPFGSGSAKTDRFGLPKVSPLNSGWFRVARYQGKTILNKAPLRLLAGGSAGETPLEFLDADQIVAAAALPQLSLASIDHPVRSSSCGLNDSDELFCL